MCEGASKQFQELINYTVPGQRPHVYKFLDPPQFPQYIILPPIRLVSSLSILISNEFLSITQYYPTVTNKSHTRHKIAFYET